MMTPHQLLEALRARWALVGASVVLAVGAAYGLTRTAPKLYTSTAAIVIDVTESVRDANRTGASEPSRVYLATQLDIIRSLAVASLVVEQLDLVNDPYFAELASNPSPSVPLEQRIRNIVLNGMSAAPSRDSQVVTISFTSMNPAFSARVANAFADAYLELVLDMSVAPARRQAEWFGEQRHDIRQWVEEARSSLTEFQQDRGILTTDERLDIETAKLQDLADQVVAAQTQVAEAAVLISELERQLASGRALNTLPAAATSRTYEELVAELSNQDARIDELAGTLGAQHPRLVRAREERRNIEARLEREVREIRASLRRNQELQQARHDALRADLEAQRSLVLELNLARSNLPLLQREVENAEDAYRFALEQLSANTLQSRLQNVRATVLYYAEPALRHSSPSLRKNVAAGGFLGTFSGLMLVLLMEWRNPRIRGPRPLQALGVPYLGRLA